MILPLLLSLSLPLLSLAAPSAASRLAKFSSLASKSPDGLIHLDSQLYDELTQAPREYSVSVLLTAMAPQFKCQPCVTFEPEHALVARQWSKQQQHDQHFFAVLDFADGQLVYQRLGLANAPTFQLFKPTAGERATDQLKPEVMDFSRSGFKAEALATYIKDAAKVPLVFSRPVDKAKVFSTVVIVVGTIGGGIRAWPVMKIILTRTYLWSFGTMFIILIMTSGYMWNQIRHPPYVQQGQGGSVSYIAGGYSNQVGAETHIVSAMYGVLAFAAYTLAHTIPKLSDPTRQRLGVYVWTGISVVMLGVLMNVFKIKQGAYPFSFL
ncbi:oligosaccharyltransferase complex subunit gamma, partial [Phenoliferia sp. Uapishka_3]